MTHKEGPGAKKVPERRCVACRTLKPRNSLIRLVRLLDGTVALDNRLKLHGRGAYVCNKRECVDGAAKRGGLARALRRPVPPELMKDVIALVQEMN